MISLDADGDLADSGRYLCAQCDPASRTTFADMEALWADHFFEPVATWLREKLRPAEALAYYRSEGATWAKLLELGDDIDGAAVVISAHSHE